MAVTANLNFNWLVSNVLATSYVGLTKANSYFLRRVNSANWTAADDDEKAIALMTATRAIDAYPGIGDYRFQNYDKNQALIFPNLFIANVQGYADSSTSTTLVDDDLAYTNVDERPDDFWNEGSIKIVYGTGRGQIREVSDFDSATGTITVSEAWATNPDTTSLYELVAKIPNDIVSAACEIAYLYLPDATTAIISEGSSQREKLQMQGVVEFRVGEHSENFGDIKEIAGYLIPGKARNILDKYVAWFA